MREGSATALTRVSKGLQLLECLVSNQAACSSLIVRLPLSC